MRGSVAPIAIGSHAGWPEHLAGRIRKLRAANLADPQRGGVFVGETERLAVRRFALMARAVGMGCGD